MQDTVPPNREQVKGPRPGIPRALVNSLADWLIQQALADAEVERLVSGCCERLLAIGVPLQRGYAAFSVLHPLHSGLGITWQRGAASRLEDYPHSPGGVNTGFTRSPQFYMMERGLEFLRIRLEPKPRHYDFPVLADLIGQGATDYVAYLVSFDGTSAYSRQAGAGMMGSWASDHAEGFSDQDIEVLLRIQPRLALACKVALRSQLMRNVSKTYLGRTTGKRVLSGQIKRGDGEAIDAAIYYADLRGSTAMADRLPRQEYIATLNQFFDVVGGAVKSQGGEILSFIGDGMLAIFPTDDGNLQEACRRAYDAAVAAHAGMDALNRERTGRGEAALGFGIGLHEGEVMFGNVGVSDRLTFSVFGAAVNEVSRLDSLTKELGEPVLATDNFAFALPRAWRALGSFELKGVARRVMVLTPRCEAERRGEGHHQRDVPTDE